MPPRAVAKSAQASHSRGRRLAAEGAGPPTREPPSAIHFNSSRRSLAFCQRSSGSLARQFETRWSSAVASPAAPRKSAAADSRISPIRSAAFAVERLPAGDHLEEHRAERKDIGARIRLETFELFRRHVVKGAEDGPRAVRSAVCGDGCARDMRAAADFASPKSRSLTPAFVTTITLPGLRSRCTTPWRWALSSASAI